MKKRAFTMLEVLIVVVVVSILAAIAFPNYFKAKEHALDSEAKANLKLVQAAERIYRLDIGGFYGTLTQTQINTNLKLSLPSGAGKSWDYTTATNAGGTTGCVKATRTDGGSRWWALDFSSSNEPVSNGACP